MQSKNVFVTGGMSEIGSEICKVLAKNNYNIYFQYFSKNNMEVQNFIDMIKIDQVNCFGIKADFTNLKDIDFLIQFILNLDIKIDHFINCAGTHEKFLQNYDEMEIFNYVYSVNIFAPIYILKKIKSIFTNNKNSSIILISSIYVKNLKNLKNIFYASSKNNLLYISKVLSKEFFPIRSNVIIPGFVDTKFFRFGKTEDEIIKIKNTTSTKELVTPKKVAESVLKAVLDNKMNNQEIIVESNL